MSVFAFAAQYHPYSISFAEQVTTEAGRELLDPSHLNKPDIFDVFTVKHISEYIKICISIKYVNKKRSYHSHCTHL